MNLQALAFGMPSGGEWLIIGLVALLLFGRRLPEVAQSLGQSIIAFKRGLREVNQDVERESRLPSPSTEGRDAKVSAAEPQQVPNKN